MPLFRVNHLGHDSFGTNVLRPPNRCNVNPIITLAVRLLGKPLASWDAQCPEAPTPSIFSVLRAIQFLSADDLDVLYKSVRREGENRARPWARSSSLHLSSSRPQAAKDVSRFSGR